MARTLKSRGVLLGLMLYLLNGFVTTWIGFVMPLVAFDHFHFNVGRYGWLMVGVSGTATVASLTMAFLSKTRCMADNKSGDKRSLIACYTFMIIAIVISYLGGPSVSVIFCYLSQLPSESLLSKRHFRCLNLSVLTYTKWRRLTS